MPGCNAPNRPPAGNADYGLDEPDDVPPANPEGMPDSGPPAGHPIFDAPGPIHDAAQPPEPSASDDWPILFRYSGLHAGRPLAMRVVARNEATFRQLGLPEVNVNWDKEMVLVAALGRTPQADMMIEIQRIEQRGSTLVPIVRLTRLLPGDAPEREGAPLSSIRSPYELVVVPASDKNVVGFTIDPPGPDAEERLGRGGIPNAL